MAAITAAGGAVEAGVVEAASAAALAASAGEGASVEAAVGRAGDGHVAPRTIRLPCGEPAMMRGG